MPKSLAKGESKIVPVKCPDAEKAALVAMLREGETISSLTRELWRDEVKRRSKKKH